MDVIEDITRAIGNEKAILRNAQVELWTIIERPFHMDVRIHEAPLIQVERRPPNPILKSSAPKLTILTTDYHGHKFAI
ncbi:hypothetical protein TNCT_131391 [Trichonephila clavata]|uniref:Uncharacterized protein n=1 Tax=Trichonephila clavata TaxID=2740835 RepID=A0A8X6FR86_TRICU|nr:hypothetical protein TNCT_131391 [Trichonephila clavata]